MKSSLQPVYAPPPYRRIRSRAWYCDDDSTLSDTDTYDYSDAPELRPPKKSKKYFARNGGKSSLELLPKMPIDILYEIFSHLHPSDVLHLARTTQRLREILLSRDARSVWKSSLSHVFSLPDCPPDLNEPQFASLVFDDHCHFCLAPKVKEIMWICRVRCCRSCIKKQFISSDDLELWMPESIHITRTELIFPYTFYPKPTPKTHGRLLYFLPTVEKYIQELEDKEIVNDEVSLRKWGQEKKALQVQRINHAALCEHWSTYWVYHGAQECDPLLLVFLILLLLFLWRDTIFY